MTGPQRIGTRLLWIVLSGLLLALAACTGSPGGSAADLAALRQQVAAQATKIAALETRAVAPPPAAAAAQPTAGGPQPTAAPTPAILPPVAGLTTAENTKGAATAKVTITEFTDYL